MSKLYPLPAPRMEPPWQFYLTVRNCIDIFKVLFFYVLPNFFKPQRWQFCMKENCEIAVCMNGILKQCKKGVPLKTQLG